MIWGEWILVAALSSSGSLAAQNGLFGEYYNNSGASAGSPPPPPGSPAGTTFTGTPVLRRADASVNFNFVMNPGPGPGVNADDFMISWRGFLTPPVSGAYQFGTISDDGIRLWVNNVLVRNDWVDQGPAAAPEMGGSLTLTADIPVTIRVEMYENGGGQAAQIYWAPPGGGVVAIPSSALSLPPGPAAAITTVAAGFTPSNDPIINIAWSDLGADITYELQRSINGSSYTTLLSGTTTTTYTDMAEAYNVPHNYRVRATQYGLLVGPYSSGADFAVPVPPPARTVDHGEGLKDGHCACGSASGPAPAAAAALAALALGLALRRRPS